MYSISNQGRIRNDSNNRIRKNTINNMGYYIISFRKEGKSVLRLVHRLVAIAFISNTDKNKDCVNHVDGNKINNFSENLEWCTKKENNAHAVKTGLSSLKKPVISENITTKEIKIFESAREAERITGIDYRQISDACNKKQKTAHGYYWNFV